MQDKQYVSIDGRAVPIEGERNMLELIRKAGIDLPTFCYHSELSVYGACRLCIIDVKGRGIQGACSTPPEAGMTVRTSTEELREMRKITLELLLANHDQRCPTCPKNGSCQLQSLARRFGIDEVRFKPVHKPRPVDRSSAALVRDPNRCVLCGDCTRVCSELQGIGAIDFAWRGAEAAVVPSFGKQLGEVECVNCGQCAAVCPTGALTPRPEVDQVWQALSNPRKKVVAQLAPAVRVALGEAFGMEAGAATAGHAVAALKALGFAQVYDTSFAADLTVIEEANEFLDRVSRGEKLPQFTSCCPAWVKFAEQYYPELLPNLSSCRSPQQMLGSMAKEILPAKLDVPREDLFVVSIMPCTAKKFEAQRPEFAHDGQRDVDAVITTQELARMIEHAGLRFRELEPESFDLPMGFKTGAGVIFGNSGGVTEAVLRHVAQKLLPASETPPISFPAVHGEEAVREATVKVSGAEVRVAVVHGLAKARAIAERIRAGERRWDLIEVMACPGGCIGGAGQPVAVSPLDARRRRTRGLRDADRALDLHRPAENPFITECYREVLGPVGGHKAHELLHTQYSSRRRLPDGTIDLGGSSNTAATRAKVKVCVGTNCFLKGSQHLLRGVLQDVDQRDLEDQVEVSASFCLERCGCGPNAEVNGHIIEGATLERIERAAGIDKAGEAQPSGADGSTQHAESQNTRS